MADIADSRAAVERGSRWMRWLSTATVGGSGHSRTGLRRWTAAVITIAHGRGGETLAIVYGDVPEAWVRARWPARWERAT